VPVMFLTDHARLAAVFTGTYKVKVLNQEGTWGAAGQRVFDLYAEGVKQLDGYDILAHTGGKKYVAVDATFPVTVCPEIPELACCLP
jgi:hypothetical protein